jgi:outer membrane protein OmpA-like peptidoglycan-associated protein
MRWLLAFAVGLTLAGCRTPPPPKPVPVDDALSFDAAMQAIATNLAVQLHPSTTRVQAMVDRVRAVATEPPPPALVVVDPFVDAQNGYAIMVGRRMQEAITAHARELLKTYTFQSLTADALSKAAFVMTGSVSFDERGQGRTGKAYRVNVSLTNTKTGIIAAQTSVWLADSKLDMTPLPIYQDSPVFLNDRYNKGLVETAATPVGRPAERIYFSQLSTAALIAEGQQAFSANDPKNSLALFQRAEIRDDGKSLKVYSGLYVTHLKMGNLADAEKIFGQLIAVAFRENNLSIRFLFRVNSTDFINEPKLTQQYQIWVRQLAQHITRDRACVEVQGHSSKTGSDTYNRTLSLQRADALRKILQQESSGALALTRGTGRGFQDNLVGSGSDDDRDAVDRRVEFKIIECGQVR